MPDTLVVAGVFEEYIEYTLEQMIVPAIGDEDLRFISDRLSEDYNV